MATKRWTGGAQSVTDVWTLTLSGTVISQTYTITIGNKTLTYAAGGADTVATICAALLVRYNSTSSPVPAEFKELTASGGVTNLVLTGTLTGRPSTVAFSTSGAATVAATNTTVATGPNFFSNAQNWHGGVAPVNGDTLVFDSGGIACKYGLSTILTTVTVQINSGYSGQIGLPDRNADGVPYTEYRTSSLTLDGGTLVVNSANVALCRVAFGSTLFSARVLNSGGGLNGAPAVLITGGAASSTCDVTRGSVGLAYFAGETCTCPTLKLGYVTQQSSDAKVVIGTGATVTTITKSGGTLEMNAGATTVTQNPTSGTLTIKDGAITTLNANGGKVNANGAGTIGTIAIANDGDVTFDGDPRAITVTNPITLSGPSARLRDNQKRVNSGVLTYSRSGTPLGNIEHGASDGGVLT